MDHIEVCRHIQFPQFLQRAFPDDPPMIRFRPGIVIMGNNHMPVTGDMDIRFHPIAPHPDRRGKTGKGILRKMLRIAPVPGNSIF